MRKKPPPPVIADQEAFLIEESCTVVFMLVAVGFILRRINQRREMSVRHFLGYLADFCEAAMYAFFYFFFAMYFGGLVEDLFPHLENYDKVSYFVLLRECVGQAVLNSLVSQVTVDLIQNIPIPDLGKKGKSLAAKGGGVIFGTSLFARQTHFRAKVACLAKLEGKVFKYGLPRQLLARIGLSVG